MLQKVSIEKCAIEKFAANQKLINFPNYFLPP